MKLVREHILFEKFTEDSDPIKDMNIGGIDIYQKAQDMIEEEGITHWVYYINGLIGKTIGGYFKKRNCGEDLGEKEFYTFQIYNYNSYDYANEIYFKDKYLNWYIALKNNIYSIK